MKSAGSTLRLPFFHLSLLVLLPAGAFAAQARSSSMAITVQVVRGSYSAAAAAVVATAEIRGRAGSPIDSDAECEAIGNKVIVDGVWATCSWDPDSNVYLVTVQY